MDETVSELRNGKGKLAVAWWCRRQGFDVYKYLNLFCLRLGWEGNMEDDASRRGRGTCTISGKPHQSCKYYLNRYSTKYLGLVTKTKTP